MLRWIIRLKCVTLSKESFFGKYFAAVSENAFGDCKLVFFPSYRFVILAKCMHRYVSMQFHLFNKIFLDAYFRLCSVLGEEKGDWFWTSKRKARFLEYPKTFLINCYGHVFFDQTTELYSKVLLSKEAKKMPNVDLVYRSSKSLSGWFLKASAMCLTVHLLDLFQMP